MNSLYIIKSTNISEQLNRMLNVFTQDNNCFFVDGHSDLPDLTNKRILFCVELNNVGYCKDVFDIISRLHDRGKTSMLGSVGALIVHSESELFTKSAARNIIFLCNSLGCAFLGHPLVEATVSLSNFLTWQKTINLPLEEVCLKQCEKLASRLLKEVPIKFENPTIVALHASSRNVSNTLTLWKMIKRNIKSCKVQELNVENGTIQDCIGCAYTTCKHYSKHNSCFYGGVMVNEIMPAIEQANAVIMICPNYNDALSANLTAVINRTTALYRKMSFHDKYIFSVVVSGNSGSDTVAKQLIDALNINKGFMLPPYAMIMETANDPGVINTIPDIEAKAKTFASNIIKSLTNKTLQ